MLKAGHLFFTFVPLACFQSINMSMPNFETLYHLAYPPGQPWANVYPQLPPSSDELFMNSNAPFDDGIDREPQPMPVSNSFLPTTDLGAHNHAQSVGGSVSW